MFRSCSRCGKIHDVNFKCNVNQNERFKNGEERKLRSTSRWKNKSLEIRERAHHLCEVCLDNNEHTYNGLEVHHITKIRDDESLLLDNYNLICLCNEHHRLADEGKIDKKYLQDLAKKREEQN